MAGMAGGGRVCVCVGGVVCVRLLLGAKFGVAAAAPPGPAGGGWGVCVRVTCG